MVKNLKNSAFMSLREEASLTQRQLAELVGVTDQTVSNWETGKSIPTLSPVQMLKLCCALNCTLEQLAKFTEPTGQELQRTGRKHNKPRSKKN